MTNFSAYSEQNLLGVTLLGSGFTAPSTVYLSLATSIASDGDSFTEVTTNIGYGRLPIDFSEPTSGPDWSVVNSADVTFSAATSAWGVVAHFAIHDAETIGTGNMLYWGDLTATRDVQTDDVLEFAAGNLSVRLD